MSGGPATREAMDWDVVRVFLALAREGSMRAAGRALGLRPTDHRASVGLAGDRLRGALFDRLPDGVRLNATGQQLLDPACSI
jgi:DNA-binding transcriptional LysR family regulator